MLSDDEEGRTGPHRLFTLLIVNSYRNAQIDSLNDDDQPLKLQSRMEIISYLGALFLTNHYSLLGKHYLALDWHPRAKTQFFNDKSAEDFSQDDSYHGKTVPKKQVIVGALR